MTMSFIALIREFAGEVAGGISEFWYADTDKKIFSKIFSIQWMLKYVKIPTVR